MRRPEWAPGEPGPGGGALAVAQGALLALSFTLPFSIALTEGALILGLVALAISVARGRRLTIAPSWLLPASALLVACWLVSSAFSAEPASSFFHVRKLYALLLIVLAAEAARDPGVRRRVVPLLVAGALLTTAIGLLIYVASVARDPGYRMKSLLSNQMTSAGVLAGALLWALGQAAGRRDGKRWIYLGLLIPLALGLVLTQTRSHWLGAAVGACVILVALAPRWWWSVPVAFVGLAKFGPPRLVARLYSIVDPHDPGNQGRLSMWRSGLDIIRDHPWIGVGCQDLLALYRRYRYPDWTFESGHFHNNFVQIAVMTGAVGLAAFLFWVVAATRLLLRGRRAARGGADVGLAASALAVFAALLVSGLFDFTFGDAEVVYQSYLAIGLACALLASNGVARSAPRGPQP